MTPPPIVRVTEEELRKRFNDGLYYERLDTGELMALVKRDKHPAPVASGQPHCTRSQEVFYFDRGNQEVARVHQYLLLDGTLGASGRPDPKRLFEAGILFRLHRAEG